MGEKDSFSFLFKSMGRRKVRRGWSWMPMARWTYKKVSVREGLWKVTGSEYMFVGESLRCRVVRIE